jgi:hypothetical protein
MQHISPDVFAAAQRIVADRPIRGDHKLIAQALAPLLTAAVELGGHSVQWAPVIDGTPGFYTTKSTALAVTDKGEVIGGVLFPFVHEKRAKPINNLSDLYAEIIGGQPKDADEAKARISKALFKGTECGIVFHADDRGIVVAGYAEGSDAECPTHRLDYPFTLQDFWAAAQVADDEGCELFDETHTDDEPL